MMETLTFAEIESHQNADLPGLSTLSPKRGTDWTQSNNVGFTGVVRGAAAGAETFGGRRYE